MLFKNWYDAPHAEDAPPSYEVPGQELTAAEIEQRLRELLDSGDYETLEQWISAVFGSEAKNPKDDHFRMPDCAGVTVATCTTRLRDAGLMGTITTTTLSSEDAAMDQVAGRVTDTQPVRGTEVAEGAKLQIYVNPATLPEMPVAARTIADTLALKNPDTVNDGNKNMLARHCVKYAKAAGRPTTDCTSLPILVQGNDVNGPARNEIAALARRPAWFALNRRLKPPNPRWYFNRSSPAPGCPENGKPIQAVQCDEYPFWSTLQAYGGTLNGGVVPSIRWVSRGENNRHASVLAQFYSANQPGTSTTFKGCDITPQSATDKVPLVPSTFLNIPLPGGSGIPSVGICNK